MNLFDFVKSNLSIVDVVSEYVTLRPAGSYLKGKCPFHSEKDASFTVSPDKQIFYCFGCHAGGDVISFIAKIENLSQMEAATFLIEKYNLDVPTDIGLQFNKESGKKDFWFKIHEAVARWCHFSLLKNKKALEYLFSRGISKDFIEKFELGYFPGGSRAISIFLKDLNKEGFFLKDLEDISFLFRNKNSVYSPFEERIIFPIKDIIGRYVAFGGRVFKSNDTRAKYYNSRESSFFIKGKVLFGFDLAKKNMQQKGVAFLVEGYTDCIAMHQLGFSNSVATLGTACSLDHLKLLSRYIDELVLLYDGDKAGQNAILRITQLCWEVNLELKVVLLPDGLDPASYLVKKESIEPLLEKKVEIFSFFVETLSQGFQSKKLSEKIVLSEKIIDAIASIEDPLKRDILLKRASIMLDIPLNTLYKKVNGKKTAFLEVSRENSHFNDKKGDALLLAEKKLKNRDKDGKSLAGLEEKIFFVIVNKAAKREVCELDPELLPYFSTRIRFLIERVQEFSSRNIDNDFLPDFLKGLNENNRQWILASLMKFEQDSSDEVLRHLEDNFRKLAWKKEVHRLKGEILLAKKMGETKKLLDLLQRFTDLKQKMQRRGLI